jgi:hypothetical protein
VGACDFVNASVAQTQKSGRQFVSGFQIKIARGRNGEGLLYQPGVTGIVFHQQNG